MDLSGMGCHVSALTDSKPHHGRETGEQLDTHEMVKKCSARGTRRGVVAVEHVFVETNFVVEVARPFQSRDFWPELGTLPGIERKPKKE